MIYMAHSEWSARAKPGKLLMLPTANVVMHHAYRPDLSATATVAQERTAMRQMDTFHADKGWGGIAYNWCVFQSGRIYEGRGNEGVGTHCVGMNHKSLGILVCIDGQQHAMTGHAIEAVRDVIRQAIARKALARDYKIGGHRDYDKRTCPGDKMYGQLRLLTADLVVPNVTTPIHAPKHPIAQVILDGRWHRQNDVKVPELLAALDTLEKIALTPRIVDRGAAKDLIRIINDVRSHYVRAI